jgi:hypothetical protein
VLDGWAAGKGRGPGALPARHCAQALKTGLDNSPLRVRRAGRRPTCQGESRAASIGTAQSPLALGRPSRPHCLTWSPLARNRPGFGRLWQQQSKSGQRRGRLEVFFHGCSFIVSGRTNACQENRQPSNTNKESTGNGSHGLSQTQFISSSVHQSASGWTDGAGGVAASAACLVNWLSQSWINAGLVPVDFKIRTA